MSAADTAPISAAELSELFGALSAESTLLLAVSGGPDSTALMLLAARWRKSLRAGPKLVAVTVDHGLRPEAAREARAVAKLARKLGVTHRTLRWTGRKPATGLQEAARNARYRLLAEAARKAGARSILTAHTRDDQAETVLFRLLRGSGIAGLAGMGWAAPVPVREGEGVVLVRPLLDVPKSRLIATLKAAKVSHADDPTNRDPRFARPRLRALMPALAREGLTAERLVRLAQRVARIDAALSAGLDDALGRFAGALPQGGPLALTAPPFFALPEEIALRLLGQAIQHIGSEGPVELGKLEDLHAALDRARGPARFRRTLAGAVVTLSGTRLVIERAPPRRGASKRP